MLHKYINMRFKGCGRYK